MISPDGGGVGPGAGVGTALGVGLGLGLGVGVGAGLGVGVGPGVICGFDSGVRVGDGRDVGGGLTVGDGPTDGLAAASCVVPGLFTATAPLPPTLKPPAIHSRTISPITISPINGRGSAARPIGPRRLGRSSRRGIVPLLIGTGRIACAVQTASQLNRSLT
jgi:hypothetical protein